MPESAAGKSPVKSAGLRSMTGYAQARAEEAGRAIRVTLAQRESSLPGCARESAGWIRDVEASNSRRNSRAACVAGISTSRCTTNRAARPPLQSIAEIAAAYLAVAESLRQQFHFAAEPDLAAILTAARSRFVAGSIFRRARKNNSRKLVETCLAKRSTSWTRCGRWKVAF